MKSNFINIYFNNFLLKWLGLTLRITKLIKLISREYFISPLRDHEFHLENICSINTKCGCQYTEVLTVTLDLTPDISKQPTFNDQVHYSLRIKSSGKYKSKPQYV